MKAKIAILAAMVALLGAAIIETTPVEKDYEPQEEEAVVEYVDEESTAYGADWQQWWEETVADEPVEVVYENDIERYKAMLTEAAIINGLNPKLMVAVSALETGWWTSDLFVNGHNFGGITRENELETYERETDGLYDYIDVMKWYHDHGRLTPEQMTAYSENPEWASLVRQIMEEL